MNRTSKNCLISVHLDIWQNEFTALALRAEVSSLIKVQMNHPYPLLTHCLRLGVRLRLNRSPQAESKGEGLAFGPSRHRRDVPEGGERGKFLYDQGTGKKVKENRGIGDTS